MQHRRAPHHASRLEPADRWLPTSLSHRSHLRRLRGSGRTLNAQLHAVLWTGCRTHEGYGRLTIQARPYSAHRVAYVIERGALPGDRTLDHLCRNPSCVNPAHLEPVTMVENVMRGECLPAQNSRKTHCIRGHAFTPENTRIDRGTRSCRQCDALRAPRLKHHRSRALGLCVQCLKPSGTYRCESCRAIHNASNRGRKR